MITRADLTAVGKVNKTHGIDGELSISILDVDVAEAIQPGDCMMFDINGIFVPFFVVGVRSRGNESLLITLDGETSREAVASLVGKDVYMKRERIENILEDIESSNGLYAGSLIGFKTFTTDGSVIGIINDIDDSSDNPLFIIKNIETGKSYLIPIVDSFIEEICDDYIVFNLPDGLLDI